MRGSWELPEEKLIIGGASDWLQLTLSYCNNVMRHNLLLLLWRAWYARNQMKHEGRQMPIEGSVRFLISYKASLLQIRQKQTKANKQCVHKKMEGSLLMGFPLTAGNLLNLVG